MKCYLYSDNICRKNNQNCVKCLYDEYHSLYKLNYDNQVKAEKQLRQLKAENKELKKTLKEINLYFSTHCTDKRELYVDKLLVDCNRAEQKLEKIKQIAEENIERCEKCKNETDDFIEELDCFEMICQYRPLKDFSVEILKVIEE